jgi:hypothetical protein
MRKNIIIALIFSFKNPVPVRSARTVRGAVLGVMSAVLLLSALKVRASEVGRGGEAGAFLRLGAGARAMAMGGGTSALADDAMAGYYNPAGLAFLEGKHVGFTLNSMALDRTLSCVGYAQSFGSKREESRIYRPDFGPIGDNAPDPDADTDTDEDSVAVSAGQRKPMQAGFSIAWLGAGVDDIDGRDYDGNHTRMYSNWENAFYFSFAIKPNSVLSLGFSAKLLWSTFPRLTDTGKAMSATGLGFDLGAMARPVPSVTIGVSIHDLRSRYTWDSQKLYERGSQTIARFPVGFSAAVAWRGFSGRILATAGMEQYKTILEGGSRAEPAALSAGIQAEPVRDVFLRAGVRSGPRSAARNAEFTFGFGASRTVFSKRTELDYAFVPDPVAPRGNHVFGWSLVF